MNVCMQLSGIHFPLCLGLSFWIVLFSILAHFELWQENADIFYEEIGEVVGKPARPPPPARPPMPLPSRAVSRASAVYESIYEEIGDVRSERKGDEKEQRRNKMERREGGAVGRG